MFVATPDKMIVAAHKALVVVPTTLLTNWAKEIQRFAPGLTYGIFHGAKRELKADRPDVTITTYGVIRRSAAMLAGMQWHLLVADEAQNIKNPAAAQTKALKSVPATNHIAMSGTPVENRLADYWSIVDFVNPGYLGTLKQFEKEFATPIQVHGDHSVVDQFKRVTAPLLLRRLKTDKTIINDLPDKIEQDRYCALTDEQAALYKRVLDSELEALENAEASISRHGLVFRMTMALKQICNHPTQYLKSGVLHSGKSEALFELLDSIYERHEKVLLFTQFREMGEILADWHQSRYGLAPLFLHGGTTTTQRNAMVERFQTDPVQRIMLITLKAGGTGLNLTAASHVIHYDLWWNRAAENQASDRAWRIGQHANVQVYRFITQGTFEERINEMIQGKGALADLTVGAGDESLGSLSNAELRDLFSLRRGT
ncbi:Uncharacterized ATP-dependent helicase YwqA (fragment) (plasmid) [Cupriavidus taiwanensis]|uniref:Uncharacterized ATP-dependent helicase YwqA n=7 Tax=Burkholderiaceae TaxID=119060 RepID=A0A375GRT8_9BURK